MHHRLASSPRRAWPLAFVFVVSFAMSLAASRPAHAAASTWPTGFLDEPMATGLNVPVGFTEVPDPANVLPRRVLFVEQVTARVRLLSNGTVTTVGTVPSVNTNSGERGLLGVAVDPQWPSRPYVYVHCTDLRNGTKVAISRFTLAGDLAGTGNGLLTFDAATRYDLRADLPDNASNHNGGTVHFGPDGMLYVSLGDDAAGCPAQDPKVLAGKILRLDVTSLPPTGTGPAPYALLTASGNPYATSTDSTARLVWTVGLRNPFRFTIDRVSGALVIGDVGQDTWEEVDYVATGGMDMGWPVWEGPATYTTCVQTPPAPFTAPIAWFDHVTGSSVIGGPRYRRPGSGTGRFPAEYEGNIFFLDYYGGMMRRLVASGSSWVAAPAVPGQPNVDDFGTGLAHVSDVDELSDGSLWYCRQYVGGSSTGELRRVTYTGTADTGLAPVSALALLAPRPNPARPSTTVRWTQPAAAPVALTVYGLDGRRVRALLSGDAFGAGPHDVTWDGRDDAGRAVRAGAYFVRLEVGGERRDARVMLLR